MFTDDDQFVGACDCNMDLLTYDDMKDALGELKRSQSTKMNEIRDVLQEISDRIGDAAKLPKLSRELAQRLEEMPEPENSYAFYEPFVFGEPTNHDIHNAIIALDGRTGRALHIILDYCKMLLDLLRNLKCVEKLTSENVDIQKAYQALSANFEEQRLVLHEFQVHYQVERIRTCLLDSGLTESSKDRTLLGFRQRHLQLLKRKAVAYDTIMGMQARATIEPILGDTDLSVRERIMAVGYRIQSDMEFQSGWTDGQCKSHVVQTIRARMDGKQQEAVDPRGEYFRVAGNLVKQFVVPA